MSRCAADDESMKGDGVGLVGLGEESRGGSVGFRYCLMTTDLEALWFINFKTSNPPSPPLFSSLWSPILPAVLASSFVRSSMRV